MINALRKMRACCDLDPDALENNQIVSTQDTWTDYDGDEPYTEYRVDGAQVTHLKSFELGLGTFDWTGNQPHDTTAKYFHADHLGTTRHMSDITGAAGDASVYTAFGVLKSGTGHEYGYDGAWGYRSDLADTATSGGSGDPVTDPRLGFPFLHVGHRYYDPSTGRFLQRDPIGIAGGSNVYVYADLVPTMSVDPDGLDGDRRVPGKEKGRGDDPMYNMTPEELEKELEKAKNAKNSERVRKIQEIQKQKGWRNIAKRAKNFGKQVIKRGSRKIPLVGIGLFLWDWYNDGLGSAVNCATWPVSELWADD